MPEHAPALQSSRPQREPGRSRQPAAVGPTIRGVFVLSHLNAVRRRHGQEGIRRLERVVGRPLRFRAGDEVPVALEVRIIEAAVPLLVDHPVPADEVAVEAGRLHYRNFSRTPWNRVLLGLFPRDFAFMVRHGATIAERVFRGLRVQLAELAPKTFKITMENADYPLDHFKGFFQEWMHAYGAEGSVVAQKGGPRTHQYLLQWS